MRIGACDLPLELVAAQRRGDLVHFIGAGASIDEPSSLPTFTDLTATIVEQSRWPAEAIDDLHPDRALGEIDTDGSVDVHQRVAQLIDVTGSEPNALHRAIIRLAHSAERPRIVTTNYDLHLSRSAADAESAEIPGVSVRMMQ